jgi:prolyl oligopeptidase PreP (S9A serine peptidase family)
MPVLSPTVLDSVRNLALHVVAETTAGHGAGKPTTKVLDEYSDVYSFLAHELSR